MNSVGVMIDNLGPSQLSFYTIQQLNLYSKKEYDSDYCVFINNICQTVIEPNFAIMNMSESMSFNGHLIASSFELADKLINLVNSSKKHFHIWELEWIKNPYLYEKYISIIRNKELNLSTRSAFYANTIEKYSGVKITNITHNFNIKRIINGTV